MKSLWLDRKKVRFVFEIVSAIFIWEVSYKEELNRWIQYDTSASKLFLKPDLKYGTGQLPKVKAFVISGKKKKTKKNSASPKGEWGEG